MATYRELEASLRASAGLYNQEVPPIEGFERRIMARLAITPREERRRPIVKRELVVSTLVAAAIIALVIAVAVGVRSGLLHQPTVPAKQSPQTQASPAQGFAPPGGCPGWSKSSGSTGPATASDKMTSRTVGWASGALRTTDGGAHWARVTPGAMRADAPNGTDRSAYPPSYTDYFLDANHAWLAYSYPSATSCFDHITVFSTVDGQIWTRSRPVSAAVQADSMLQLQLYFVDPQRGWLLVLGEGRIAPDWFAYTTMDGGLDWQLTSQIPMTGSFCAMEFISRDVGFLAGCPNASGALPQLTVTRDGGKTWQTLDLPAPVGSSFSVGRPFFFDQSRGIVDVTAMTFVGNTETPYDYLAVTDDGGQSWHALAPLSMPGYVQAFGFIDPNHFVALVTDPTGTTHSIYRTSDGGRTWNRGADVPSMDQNYPQITFVDSQHGFIEEPSQSTGQAPIVLLATSDGGRTWKDMHPHLS